MRELTKAPRPRFFIAPHAPYGVAAKRLGQRLKVLRHIARQRRGEVVAQRKPLLVLILQGEHALVGPILVGQKFAQCIRVLKRWRLQRLKAIGLINRPDLLQHGVQRAQLGRFDVAKAFRQACLGPRVFFGLGHGMKA